MSSSHKPLVLPRLTWCLIAVLSHPWSLFGQTNGKQLRFENYSINEGLSQSNVYAVLQDRFGFLWIGTEDGLNRFDGYNFEVYRNNPDDNGSISANTILAIHQDRSGRLWIGTQGGGLNQFDRDVEAFIGYRFEKDVDPTQTLNNNFVTQIEEDYDGDLWLGTQGGGINCFLVKEGRFLHFNRGEITGISDDNIHALHFDQQGNLWIGTYKGLDVATSSNLIDAKKSGRLKVRHIDLKVGGGEGSDIRVRTVVRDKKGSVWAGTVDQGLFKIQLSNESADLAGFQVSHYQRNLSEPNGLTHAGIRALLEDDRGNFWIGSDGGGLFLMDRDHDLFYNYANRAGLNDTLSSDRILSLYQDSGGLLWVGTFVGGLNKVDLAKSEFTHLSHDPLRQNLLSDNTVKAIFEDHEGHFWIGHQEGVDLLDVEEKGAYRSIRSIARLSDDPLNEEDLSHNFVRAIAQDLRGQIWIGTWGGGLNQINPKTFEVKHYKNDPDNPGSLSHNLIRSLLIDQKGRMWIGVSNGLNLYNPKDDTFRLFQFGAGKRTNFDANRVSSIYQDQANRLWLGTEGGLIRFNPDDYSYQKFTADQTRNDSLSSNRVRPILQDKRGRLWIGTLGGGLNLFDPIKNSSRIYTTDDGLPNNVVYGILEDEQGYLWISTNNGLSRFDPKNEQFRNYIAADGLQSNEFNIGAYFKDGRGRLWFGGINGLTMFDPDTLTSIGQGPQIVITDFRTNDENFQLPQSPHRMEQIVLPPSVKSFGVSFAALDFSDPRRNQFSFQLEGLEESWSKPDTNNRTNFTNLDPGEYTLKIRGADKSGQWSEKPLSVGITIVPPWWLTRTAYLIYFLLITGIAWAGIRYYLGLQNRRHQRQLAEKQREIEQEHLIVERLRQVDKLKDEFLANTSHELRTPLNGIIGIVESLMDGVTGELPPKTNHNLAMVLSSAKRLSNLVNDILDYAKIKESGISLNLKPVDLRALTHVILTLLEPMAREKGIRLENAVDNDIPPVNADENRLQQIMYNLVGNAVKFTQSGSVVVRASQEEDLVHIDVSDTGIGIPSDKLVNIFKSFEQVDGSSVRGQGGTGLGLAITKQLVEGHGGEIRVTSVPGQGSTFSFTLPASDERIFSESFDRAPESLAKNDIESDNHIIDEYTLINVPAHAYHILVVDDEPVNLQVLVNYLSLNQYQITRASDGLEAVEKIYEDDSFDLVICDVMMPRMNGYEVCKRIRKRYSPRRLPVILLTAKDQVSDMAAGFEAGANDYLTKPVTKDELIPRIETHLSLLAMHRDLKSAKEAAKEGAFARETAQFATSILHNIGNVLTSVKISCQQVREKLERSRVHGLVRAGEMLRGVEDDIATFLTQDPKGKMLPQYFQQIGGMLMDEQQHILKEIDNLANKADLMADIIETQQQHAKAGHSADEVFDLRRLIDESLDLQQQTFERKGVALTRKRADEELWVKGQKLHVTQVLMNLFKNAVEAMAETPVNHRFLEVAAGREESGGIYVTVRDRGIGISQTGLEKMFSHGYTTKKTGHGFGLHYCKNVMKNMNGDITVDSEGEGKGACFTLRFQAAPPAVSHAGEPIHHQNGVTK